MKKRILLVTFDECSKEYAYKTYDASINVGDSVIVGIYGADDFGEKLRIATVSKDVSDDIQFEKLAKKTVIGKVNLDCYFKGCDYEKKISSLMKKARKRYEELEEITKYKIMAENDESMKSILNEIASLEKESEADE